MDAMRKTCSTVLRPFTVLVAAIAVAGCAIPHQISVTSPELGDSFTVTGKLDALDLAIDPGRQCMEQVGVPKLVRLQFDAPIDASTVTANLTGPA
jgi:hypothetical protein